MRPVSINRDESQIIIDLSEKSVFIYSGEGGFYFL